MKKDESKSWNEHIAEFESRWTTANSRLSTATTNSKAWIRGLQLAFSDEEFKAHLLLSTLPSTMDNIVDNLRTKEAMSYSDVRTRLLGLSSLLTQPSCPIRNKRRRRISPSLVRLRCPLSVPGSLPQKSAPIVGSEISLLKAIHTPTVPSLRRLLKRRRMQLALRRLHKKNLTTSPRADILLFEIISYIYSCVFPSDR